MRDEKPVMRLLSRRDDQDRHATDAPRSIEQSGWRRRSPRRVTETIEESKLRKGGTIMSAKRQHQKEKTKKAAGSKVYVGGQSFGAG
jgi:hypothetical protein